MELLSNLELGIIDKLSSKLYNDNDNEFVSKDEIEECKQILHDATNRYEICSALETLRYCFSLILSEVRDKKRSVITAVFEQKPKLAEEKSVLEKKLDAVPEYAKYKKQEELLFQFIEYISNIENNITWILKSNEDN